MRTRDEKETIVEEKLKTRQKTLLIMQIWLFCDNQAVVRLLSLNLS